MKRVFLLLFILFNCTVFAQSYLDFYFKTQDVKGAILIYDEQKDFWIYNTESDVRKKTPIGSLFHIPNTLIALDLGIVSDYPGDFMHWDGVKRYYFGNSNSNWNCNTNLDEAIQYKTDWYFQNISDLISNKEYNSYLNQIDVGDFNSKRKQMYFWHFGGFHTNSEQQILFLKKLSKQQLMFHKRHQQYIYDKMLMVKNEKYTIHGYETFNVFNGERIDWWVGVLNVRGNTYYFSTRIYEDVNKTKSKDFQYKKYSITLEIFKILGYI